MNMRIFSNMRSGRSLGAACLIAAAWISNAVAVPGLDSRPQVGAYLDGAFPNETPGSGGSYSWVDAFPNLRFNSPIRMFPEPGSTRLWVIGREGHVWFFDGETPNTSLKTLALDISDVTQGRGDCGLLGFAFHPEFGQSGSPNANFVYLYYNFSLTPTQSGEPSNVISYNRLSRFEVNPATKLISRASEFVLINQFDQHAWHNGGDMFFGPDGFLFFSNGDEGASNDPWNNAQTISKGLFAGVFRIDVDQRGGDVSHPIRRQPVANAAPPAGWPGTYTQGYYIPSDNPFVDPAGGNLEEFYAIGLRSPHRMTRDPVSGKVFIGDIGQGTQEEVSVLDGPGLNFQWAFREGVATGPKAQPGSLIGTSRSPLHAYGRSVGGCVIGGFVYRGTEHAGDLGGKYLFGDHNNGQIWTLDWEGLETPVRTPFLVVPPGNKWGGLSGFGLDHNNEIYLMLLGTQGRIVKIVRNGGGGQPPARLSETGAFTDLASLTPHPGLLPYTINSPLWSDGALKSRWIAVPNDGAPYGPTERITFSATGGWSYPVGTVIVKHFELPVDETDPESRTRLETRFLVRTAGDWYGVTYRWREDGSDADLVFDSETRDVTVATEGGGSRVQQWYFPGRTDCMQCHNKNAGQVLGLQTWQLNGDLTYPSTGRTDNQLATWSAVGLFDQTLSSGQISGFLKSVPVDDPAASLETRMRSYVDANCSHCHRPNGVRARMDARFATPLASQSIVNGFIENNLGIVGAVEVKPESTSQSIMHVRMGGLDEAIKMPPIAKNVVDAKAMQTLAAWVATLRDEAVPADVGSTAPVAGDDDATLARGASVSLPLLANDIDADAPLYYGAVSFTQLPAHGAVAVDAGNARVTYTHDGSATLTDGFKYTVSDPSGRVSNEATVTLAIEQPNLPPVVVNPGDQESVRGQGVSLQIAATDPEEQPLAFSASGLPAGLSIASDTGRITGTVSVTAADSNVVLITVTDGELPVEISFEWTTTPAAPAYTGSDVGQIGPPGSYSIDSVTGIFSVTGSGRDIFFDEDGFHFVNVVLDGDGEIRARVRSFENTNPWAKAGVMFRESLTGTSRHAMAFITPPAAGNGSGMVWRPTVGGATSYAGGPALSPNPDNWVRLVREGDAITSYASSDGVVWTSLGTALLTGLPSAVYVGLAVTSSEGDVGATATFDNVGIIGAQSVVPPGVALSSASAIEAGPFSVQAVFTQPVTGLQAGDFTVVNGTASSLTGSGGSYDILITPEVAGIVSVSLPADVVINASAVGNTASNTLSVSYAPPGVVSLPGQDVGGVLAAGGTVYEAGTQTYTVTGSGRDIFFDADGFQFAVTQLSGDGEIRARVTGQTAANPWAKAGVMFREALTGSARHAMMFTTPVAANNGFGMVWRPNAGGQTSYAAGPVLNAAPDNWVRLVRLGDTITSYTSSNGTSWAAVATATLTGLAEDLYLGLAVTSSSDGQLSTATFDNVTIVGAQVAVPPEVVLSASSANETGPFTVQAAFSQPVAGLTSGAFVVTNGIVSNLTGAGASYSVTVTPEVEGEVTVQLPADSAVNASGTGNTVSNTILVNYVPPVQAQLAGTDIGELFTLGSTSFNPTTGVYTLRASGRDIFFEADGLQFAQMSIVGDGEIRARITSQSNTNPWAKAGVMIRENLTAGSRHAMAFTTPAEAGNGYGMVWRPAADGPTSYAGGPAVNPPPANWVRIVREGNTLITYSSTDGSTWAEMDRATLAGLPAELYFGLAVTASANTQYATVTFDNVQIIGTPVAPAPPPPASGDPASASSASATNSLLVESVSDVFCAPELRIETASNGTVGASFRRSPGSAVHVMLHGLRNLADSPNGWVQLPVEPVVVDNGDGTETVSYPDLSSLAFFAGSTSGFVRLYAEGDANHDGFPDTVAKGETFGWQDRMIGQGTETLSMPFAKPAVFTGTVTESSGDRISTFGIGMPGAVPHYVEILSGSSAGHRFELNEPLCGATTLVIDLESVDAARNTLPSLPGSLVGARIAVRAHQTVNDIFPPGRFQGAPNMQQADRVLFFRDGAYETLWLFARAGIPSRWILDGDATLVDAGLRIMAPGTGLMIRRAGGNVGVRLEGIVHEAPLRLPLKAGTLLVANPWPVAGSPVSLGFHPENGFTGATTAVAADQIQTWRGDAAAGGSGFDLYFLLRAGAFHQWISAGDASLTSFNDAALAPPTRAVFLQLRADHPEFAMPVPWRP